MTRVIYKRGPSPPPFPAPDEQKWEGGGDKVSEGKRRRETGDQGQTTVKALEKLLNRIDM